MATRFEIYKQALLDLERAIAELDQVHASLKDIGLQRIIEGSHTVGDLVMQGDELLNELRIAECPECDHPIAQHDRSNGCWEELPGQFDEHTIWLPTTQCLCRWGVSEPVARQLPRST
jgi:hypothetical protein